MDQNVISTSSESLKMKMPKKNYFSTNKTEKQISQYISNLRRVSKLGLHLGAGSTKIDGLINCDLYNPDADLKVDCTNLVEFENNSVDLIETHHMLEHLSFENVEKALKDWNRVLKLDGYLIITCPDITSIAILWVKLFFKKFFTDVESEVNYVLKMIYGSQENEGMFHRSGFDKSHITYLLNKHNFNVVFSYTPYPLRPTPSLLIIAKKARE